MFKRVLILILTLSMLASVFVACSSSSEEDPPETTEPPVPTVTLATSGETAYSLVYTSKKSNEKIPAQNFHTFLTRNVDENVVLKTDAEDQPISEYEIVIGKTTREEGLTDFSRSSLKNGQFTIFFEGNRLFVLGANYQGTSAAVEYFIDHFITDDGEIKVPEGINLIVDSEKSVESVTIGGRPLSDFVIIYGSAPLAEMVAKDMQAAIRTTTGMSIEIASDASKPETDCEILIGKTNRENDAPLVDRKDLGTEGFVIEVVGTKLVITGGADEERGTAYGVYTFLETYLGVRYLSADTTYYKPIGAVTLEDGLRDRQVPIMEYRDPYWDCQFGGAISLKRKVNSGISRGLGSYGGGTEYAGWFVHTLNMLADVETTSKQPCLTDETVYHTVLNNVRKWLDQYPDAEIISVSQADGGEFCGCSNCTALYQQYGCKMGAMLTFVNRIAAVVAEEYPGVYVDTLAYTDTEEAPVGLVPADNVVIRLCPINVSQLYGIDDERMVTEYNTKFMKAIEDWSKICDKLYIWDYTTNFGYQLTPQPNLKAMYANASLYADYHVVGWFSQGWNYGNSADQADLKAYLLSHLMWDPYMEEDEYWALVEDFYVGYYGAAAPYVKEYYSVLQNLAETNARKVTYASHPLQIYGEELLNKLEELDALISKAENRVCYNDSYMKHLELVRITYRFLWLGCNFDRMFYEGTSEEKAEITRLNSEFRNDCAKLGLSASEGGDIMKYNVRSSVFTWFSLGGA